MTTAVTKTLEVVRGGLSKKEEKLSTNKKTFWALEIEGIGKAATWDKKVADSLTVGKLYEFEIEVDGQFRTVKSVKEVLPQAPAPSPAPVSIPQVPPEHQVGYIPVPKDTSAIMAQVALKSSVERANGITQRELTTAEIIQMGQEFMIAMKAWASGKIISPVPHAVAPDASAPAPPAPVNSPPPPPGDAATETQQQQLMQLGKALAYREEQIMPAVFSRLGKKNLDLCNRLEVATVINDWKKAIIERDKERQVKQAGKTGMPQTEFEEL